MSNYTSVCSRDTKNRKLGQNTKEYLTKSAVTYETELLMVSLTGLWI